LYQEPTASEQFAQDFQLVTDNDFCAYTQLQALFNQNGAHNVAWLSELLRESFENRIAEVTEREKLRGNGYTADLINQMLRGFGSTAFDKIARAYIERDQENRALNNLKAAN
jgi:hypothetical protein